MDQVVGEDFDKKERGGTEERVGAWAAEGKGQIDSRRKFKRP